MWRIKKVGKARVLGQYHSFVPNRYADVRRRPEATVNRRDRMERQREELEAAKMAKSLEAMKIQAENSDIYTEKEIQAEKELKEIEKRIQKYLEKLK